MCLKNNGDTSYKETEILLTQWKTCVEMADSVSRRRDTMNNIFITLNSAIIASFSYTSDTHVCLSFAGIISCCLWGRLIHNYKQLNSAKFDVILGIESKLPIQPFKDEWEKLQCKQSKYKRFTDLESWLPIGFIVLYLFCIC